jgi:tRNA U34 5-methylaminomethyl-2-thiouridine-forming methyltransferase MnmC
MKVILTEDGSHSIQLPEIDETYHSIHGAIQESKHVFIEAGLRYWLSKNENLRNIKILEFGFGTGLNALLTATSIPESINVSYHALEKFPLPSEIIQSLNYGEVMCQPELFDKIHRANWDEEHTILTNFSIKKIETDFRDYTSHDAFDIIYFDAFAPSKQPELWTRSIFEQCYKLLDKGGVLVTYSAKGQFKRDLKSIGFIVESVPGPPGKYEITRATKQ